MYRPKKTKIHLRLVLLGTIAALSFGAFAKLSPSDPLSREWQMSLERNLTKLSDEEGSLDLKHYPWADAQWSAVTGGPLDRYKREDLSLAERSVQHSPQVGDLQRMSPEARNHAIELLSPAEIFDLFRGYSMYPFAREIREVMKKSGTAAFDEKMNFGWVVAATSMGEPNMVTKKIRLLPKSSAEITVGSSDIKALLAYYYGAKVPNLVKIAKVGSRCHGVEDTSCKRIDAASFHILLTNMISKKGKPFIADLDPSKNVNYRPIVGYRTAVRLDHDHTYNVRTEVDFVRNRAAQIETYGIYSSQTESQTYTYTLETDADGNILRGDWISEAHPEFVWRVLDLPGIDRPGFKALKDLYEEAPFLN